MDGAAGVLLHVQEGAAQFSSGAALLSSRVLFPVIKAGLVAVVVAFSFALLSS